MKKKVINSVRVCELVITAVNVRTHESEVVSVSGPGSGSEVQLLNTELLSLPQLQTMSRANPTHPNHTFISNQAPPPSLSFYRAAGKPASVSAPDLKGGADSEGL